MTGGIACYKSAMLASLLVKRGYDVEVVMTRNATEFIGPHTFDSDVYKRQVLGEGHFNFPVLNLNLDFFHLRSVCRIAGFLKLSAAGRTPGKHPGREQDAEACDGKPGGIVAFFRFGKFHHKSVPPGFEKVDIDVSLC